MLVVHVTEYVILIGEVPVFVGVTLTVADVDPPTFVLQDNVPPAQPVAVNEVGVPLHT